jgi:heme exporter protein B
MAPVAAQAVWLGKALAGLILVLCCQLIFAVAVAVFLGQNVAGSLVMGVACVLVVDVGLASLGSFMGALASGRTSRESLLTVIFFPLIIPVLLSGIRVLEGVILGSDAGWDWLGLACAFAAVFTAAALVLFPFIYTGEE